MNILVINCGSSSLKYQLIDMKNDEALAVGLVERIGIQGSVLTQKVKGKNEYVIKEPMENHKDAIKLVLKALVNSTNGVIKSMDDIDAVGHRVVHGGENYSSSVIIDDEVMKELESCVKLAPLHNTPNIIGINVCKDLMPNTKMVAVFDTAFHQTMPEKAFLYAIPYELYKEKGIRKYGFHGTSHKYVSNKVAEVIDRDPRNLKIISCHLGNGSSVAAVKDGKSVDTSMGFTPLEGLFMGTRSGDIDSAVILHLINELGYSVDEVNDILNKKSGVMGISGVSSDFRDIGKAASQGNHRAQLALDMFSYKVRKYIGSFAVAIGGVDCIVFTAGVGENAIEIRSEICKGLEFLGFKIDSERNNVRGKIAEISTEDSKVKVYVIPTNEELMIAKDTKSLIVK